MSFGTVINSRMYSSIQKVTLPHGTKVEVHESYGDYINVWVYPGAQDFAQTRGNFFLFFGTVYQVGNLECFFWRFYIHFSLHVFQIIFIWKVSTSQLCWFSGLCGVYDGTAGDADLVQPDESQGTVVNNFANDFIETWRYGNQVEIWIVIHIVI